MDTWSGISWLWRGLRGRSVTFAALFAVTLLGFSVIATLRHLLSWLHAPWLAWFLLPILLISILARKEIDWMPDETQRLKIARTLILGSIVGAMLLTLLLPQPPPEPEPVRKEGPRRHGPPGR